MLSASWIFNNSAKAQRSKLTLYTLLTSAKDTWPWSSGHNVPWALQEQSISLLLHPAPPTHTHNTHNIYTDVMETQQAEKVMMCTQTYKKKDEERKWERGGKKSERFPRSGRVYTHYREHLILFVWAEQMMCALACLPMFWGLQL